MTPTPTDYIILAYLADGPQHGYSLIEKLTQDNLQSVAVPNIYTALRRLYRSGAIGQKIRKIRNRPDQKIYSINESGKKILAGFLEDENILRQQTRFRFDLLFLLADKMESGVKELSDAVSKRITSLSHDLECIQQDWRETEATDRGLSRMREIALRHQIRFLKSEIDFYKKLLRELKE
jgi:DNA-binding PadR family transcriptional regulator